MLTAVIEKSLAAAGPAARPVKAAAKQRAKASSTSLRTGPPARGASVARTLPPLLARRHAGWRPPRTGRPFRVRRETRRRRDCRRRLTFEVGDWEMNRHVRTARKALGDRRRPTLPLNGRRIDETATDRRRAPSPRRTAEAPPQAAVCGRTPTAGATPAARVRRRPGRGSRRSRSPATGRR